MKYNRIPFLAILSCIVLFFGCAQKHNEAKVKQKIYERLSEIYAYHSSSWGGNSTNCPELLSKGLTDLLDKGETEALKFQEIGLFDFNYWVEGQDNGKMTVRPINTISLKGNCAKVSVVIDDDDFGPKNKDFVFVYEDGDWYVDDMSLDEETPSLKAYVEEFLKDPNAWFAY